MKRRTFTTLLAAAGVSAVTAGCGGGSKAGQSGQSPVAVPSDPTKVSGDITVLTNRTDLNQDGTRVPAKSSGRAVTCSFGGSGSVWRL